MVLMVNFFTNTPCNNGLHIVVQGAVEKIELYSKEEQNYSESSQSSHFSHKVAKAWRGDKKSLFMLEHPVFK